MQKAIIARYYRGSSLEGHLKIPSQTVKQIKADIRKGDVFPTIRENKVDLYYAGGRILRIGPKSVQSHAKFQGLDGTKDVAITNWDADPDTYERIKEKCSKHYSSSDANKFNERWLVSRLFRRFSCWSEDAEGDQPKLIDVECRFERRKNKHD